MDVIVLIGRVLFGGLFVGGGIAHLTQTTAMAGYAASRGVPAPRLATILSGVLILVGGVFVILGLWADLGSLFLVAFLVPTAFLMHAFWTESDPMARQLEMVNFNKDIGLAGAALIAFAFFAYAGDDLGLTLTGPLFSLS